LISAQLQSNQELHAAEEGSATRMSVSKLRAEAAKRDKAVAKHNESVTKHTKGTQV